MVPPALGGTSRAQQADTLISTDRTKTFSLPSASDTLLGRTSTDTITNKSISGSTNTLSNLPVAAQLVQDVFYGNSSTTAFTLSFTQVASPGLLCHLDGTVLIQGSGFDYTVSGTTLTMTSAPATGQKILCYYSKF